MKYRKNYLAKVIFQLRFDPVLKLRETEPGEFQVQIKGRFPHVKPGRRVILKGELKNLLGQEEKGKTHMVVHDIENFWTFSTDDKSALLTILADEFTLEYSKYKDVHATSDDFEFLWSKFQAIYDVKTLSRVGLRYINQINFSTGAPLDWEEYINKDVIASTLGIAVPDEHRLGRSMNTIFWLADDHRIKFQFGINNRDFPNPIAKREFILDHDCFSIDPVDPANAKNYLIRYNKLIGMAFERSIDEKLRQEMEPIES